MLVVCGQYEFGRQLLSIISGALAGNHQTACSGAEARRKTSTREYDAVLIAGRLPDENAASLAIDLAESGTRGVITVVERANLFDAHEMLDGTGATILAKPLTKDALLQAIRLVARVNEGAGGLFEKAKLMLMQVKSWTEPQAHRYIQKLSMNRRLPRDVTAQIVIRALERESNDSHKA